MNKKPTEFNPKAMIQGIAVWCNHDELVDIDKLVPFPRNPNIHPQYQTDALAKIIKYQGWRTPITVSKRSGFIVRGHGRLVAAKALGLPQVPVDYQDYENEAAEWADLIADNKISELASIDEGLLRDLMGEIQAADFDMDLTGFNENELLQMFDTGEGNNDPEKEWEGMPEFNRDPLAIQSIHIHFKTREDVFKFAELLKQNITEKTRSLWFPKQEDA